MKLVFFIDIILFFAAEFTYEIFLFSVYYIFGCFTRILNQFSIKIVTKKMFTIIIPTVINC